ncbi:response regulator [Streptomyces minutiscleroticus]|uniref:Response regulatory domain-containing protein n=1 Tax=Streptomyces minutiscleroticus TaxID=68238 RepID=A0A918NRG3_9ACTN|nr:response regulator [Streptomyces minutiscleroticus]GGX90015.1 hypothetical protein GCM10010358_50030 [Streptomyces minutiscleroticus]
MATILAADDDADVRHVVAFRPAHAGHTAVEAEDGQRTWETARTRDDLALAVLDVRMPGLTGVEVRGRLRRDPATARLPVILLTAQGGEDDVEAGFGAGADDYVAKPFSPREVGSRMRAVLARTERHGV